MTIRSTPSAGLAAASLGLAALCLSGCGSGEPESVAIPVAAPARSAPPPPRPTVTPVAQLMAELGIDARVVLPEERAPATTAERKAVLEFFDAFVRGDAAVLKTMMSGLDADELEAMVDNGTWSETIATIDRIEVQTGMSPDGQNCALAIFWTTHDFQPQMWYYLVDNSGSRFDAVAAPPHMMDELHGDNFIARWFEVLADEMALADKPDEEVVIAKRDISDTSDRGSYDGPSGRPEGPSGPGDPSRPSAPSGPGRREKGPKRPAPGQG